MELGVVIRVYALLWHNLFLRMIKSDVPVVLLDSGLGGTPGLSNAELFILSGDAVVARCSQERSSWQDRKKMATLLGGRTFSV